MDRNTFDRSRNNFSSALVSQPRTVYPENIFDIDDVEEDNPKAPAYEYNPSTKPVRVIRAPQPPEKIVYILPPTNSERSEERRVGKECPV